MDRVRFYIDGFNFYHAVDELGENHLKWVDLWKLASLFVDKSRQQLDGVHYFTAYAKWLPASFRRHVEFVRAQEACGVCVDLSEFYEKTRRCPRCKRNYRGHEEKQSDVKMATCLLDHAYQDGFDRALMLTRDSDLTPAIKLVRGRFPKKKIFIIAPPERRHSKALAQAVASKKHLKKIRKIHLEKSLLPREVKDNSGKVVAIRPPEYDPPI